MQGARRQYKQAMKRYRKAVAQQAAYDAGGSTAELKKPGAPAMAFDDALEIQLSDLQRQGDRALAQKTAGQSNLYNEFYDPANPYGRVALMEKSIDDARRGLDVNNAARGKMYSGQNQAQMQDQQFEFGQQRNQLTQEFIQRSGDVDRSYADTASGLASQGAGAIYDSVRAGAMDVQSTAAPTMQAMGLDAMGRPLKKPKKKFLIKPIKPGKGGRGGGGGLGGGHGGPLPNGPR